MKMKLDSDILNKPILRADNQKSWPKEYVCNILEPGLVSYEDVGCGLALLRKQAIIDMLPSFIGKPVIFKEHIDVTPKDFEEHAVGYVTKAWWDDSTNWAYLAFIVIDDPVKDAIERKGYSVSCAYDVLQTSAGGEWHAIKYNEEIVSGSGTHLALVLSPRYEGCKILVNCKNAKITEGQGKNLPTLNICNGRIDLVTTANSCYVFSVGEHVRFRMRSDKLSEDGEIVDIRKEGGVKIYTVKSKNGLTYELKVSGGIPQNFQTLVRSNQKKEASKMIQLFKKKNSKGEQADQVFVKIENQMVAVSDLAKLAKAENGFEEHGTVENEVEIDGAKHNMADLIEVYKASNKKKKNEDKEEDKENDDEEEKKENEVDAEVEKNLGDANNSEDEEEKDNEDEEDDKENDDQDDEQETIKKANARKKKDANHFVRLNKAKERGDGVQSLVVDTLHNRIDRGASRYGSGQ